MKKKTNESVPYLRRITVQRRNHKRKHEFGSNEWVNERTNERQFEWSCELFDPTIYKSNHNRSRTRENTIGMSFIFSLVLALEFSFPRCRLLSRFVLKILTRFTVSQRFEVFKSEMIFAQSVFSARRILEYK